MGETEQRGEDVQAETPWVLRRVGRTGDWSVIDRSNGEAVGTVFKYLGYWRANTGQGLQRSTKERAAVDAWVAHIGRHIADGSDG